MSAEHIVGAHLDPGKLAALERLARSESLWERRIAILSTFHGIKQGIHGPALHVAGMLVNDPHDLIHKAVGWMLRVHAAGLRQVVRSETARGTAARGRDPTRRCQ
ncbi:MAG: DNA alkylation repair protein [Acidimicrobiia bacterium]|nr:DNA alkylation repair protein [Acidimicrobiia bacterium]